MAACMTQQSSSAALIMSNMNYPRKLLRSSTYDSLIPIMTCRKRLLSEQNECQNSMLKSSNDDINTHKKFKTESRDNDVNNDNHQHVLSFSSYSSFENENTTQSPSSPGHQRHKTFTHINNVTSPESTVSPQSSSSSTTTTTKNMLLCQQQQQSVIDNPNNENEQQEEKTNSSIFVTCAQLSAYMTSVLNNQNENLLIIDCGSPLRHNERRIKESFLLNINDRLSRKRLITRGLKTFLDQNQLARLNQSQLIILYDDTIQSTSCSNSNIQLKISPILQCIYDEIKRYDSNKIISILQSSFEEFYQHYPTHCYTSSTDDNHDQQPLPSPTIDIDSIQMSEVLPGLYLGNAHDAKDMNLLKSNQIKFIINISTTIPCYYQTENFFEYVQLHCNDSSQENILQYFDKIFEDIHKKFLSNENILVHCQGGISRSPSFIIGYLMKYHSKTFDQAYSLVKDKRKIINPNLNFLAQLTRYEQMITSDIMQ